jgi:hypothetical protein
MCVCVCVCASITHNRPDRYHHVEQLLALINIIVHHTLLKCFMLANFIIYALSLSLSHSPPLLPVSSTHFCAHDKMRNLCIIFTHKHKTTKIYFECILHNKMSTCWLSHCMWCGHEIKFNILNIRSCFFVCEPVRKSLSIAFRVNFFMFMWKTISFHRETIND